LTVVSPADTIAPFHRNCFLEELLMSEQTYAVARPRWIALLLFVLLFARLACAQQQPPELTSAGVSADGRTQGPPPTPIQNDVVIRNGTILTATHGRIEHGSIYVHNGKIAAVGATVDAPASATVIDATGKFVTPGIIDPHSHMALDNDVNEMTSPVVPHMMMIDAFDYTDKAIYRALAGGVTTSLLLHGSGDMIGGQAVVIKNKYGLSRDQMLFPNAPRSIKFASGENPKRVFGSRNQLPSTRMGNFEVQRAALQEGREYMREWDDYNAKVKAGDKNTKAPKRDLRLEALADILRGKLLVQIHCYRADEFLTEMAIAREFGYHVRAFHHALESYKVADQIAKEGVAIATFADWWGYKNEAWDATPWNAVMSMRKGVRVALKSDSNDLMRRLNQEAGKMIRYGGATEDEALQMITINPAWIIGVDDRTGSIDVGKDADIVIWNGEPLSSYALADKVMIDGEVYFDRSLPGYGLTHYKAVPENTPRVRPSGFESEVGR
jgi:imidazolonepropionase-like amidohydrolase